MLHFQLLLLGHDDMLLNYISYVGLIQVLEHMLQHNCHHNIHLLGHQLVSCMQAPCYLVTSVVSINETSECDLITLRLRGINRYALWLSIQDDA
jgi:hypothetical protein